MFVVLESIFLFNNISDKEHKDFFFLLKQTDFSLLI